MSSASTSNSGNVQFSIITRQLVVKLLLCVLPSVQLCNRLLQNVTLEKASRNGCIVFLVNTKKCFSLSKFSILDEYSSLMDSSKRSRFADDLRLMTSRFWIQENKG